MSKEIIWIVAAIVAVVTLIIWRLRFSEEHNSSGNKPGRRPDKNSDKKGSDDNWKKLALKQLKKAWETSKIVLKSVLFLIPYYAIAFVLSEEFPKVWEPWLKNQLLFFVLIPAAILFPIIISFKLKEKKDRVLPLAGASILLLVLGIAAFNKYAESEWFKEWRAEEARVTQAKKVKEVKPTRYKIFWVKPTGVDGRNKEVRSSPPLEGRVHEENGIFEWFAIYEQQGEWYTGHGVGRRTAEGLIEGTWSQPNPKELGTWRLKETAPGRFFGSYTDGSLRGAEASLLFEPIK